MDQKQQAILNTIDETRADLTSKIGQLENQVRDTVQNAKSSVEDTIDSIRGNIKGTVESMKQTIDPVHQTKEHPWIMVGTSVATGFAVGAWLATPAKTNSRPIPYSSSPTKTDPPVSSPNLLAGFISQFDEEIQMLKGMAAGAVITKVNRYAKKAFPDFEVQIKQVLDSAESKLVSKRTPARKADSDWHKSQTTEPPMNTTPEDQDDLETSVKPPSSF